MEEGGGLEIFCNGAVISHYPQKSVIQTYHNNNEHKKHSGITWHFHET